MDARHLRLCGHRAQLLPALHRFRGLSLLCREHIPGHSREVAPLHALHGIVQGVRRHFVEIEILGGTDVVVLFLDAVCHLFETYFSTQHTGSHRLCG